MNAFSFLTRAAQVWPLQPAVICSGHTLSFRKLLERAESTKNALFEAGIRPGMGLGLIADNGPEFVIGLFAGLASGAVVMPLSPNLTTQEFSRILELVPLAGFLHDGSLNHPLTRATSLQRGTSHITLRPKEYQVKVAPGVSNPAVIRFTSGTTGSSKGVVLSHESVHERTEAAIEGLRLNSGDTVVWVLPMAYHFIVSILTYVRYGITLALPSDSTAQAILTCAQRHAAALIYASPAIIQSLARDPSTGTFPRSTRVVSTSSGLYPQHAQAFRDRFGSPVGQLYGLIEVGLPIGTSAVEGSLCQSVGAALPRYEVAILDPSGHPLPPGHLGSLAVRGPGMFDAYLAPFRPAEEVLVHGWFLTGDLAIKDYDGNVTVKGREKSVINVSGNKVFPEEVEGILNSFPGVEAARVYGVERAETSEMVVAEIVTRDGCSIDIEALAEYASQKLSPYKLPASISIVPRIAMTDSGKIRRVA